MIENSNFEDIFHEKDEYKIDEKLKKKFSPSLL